jgi:hypothetical protein
VAEILDRRRRRRAVRRTTAGLAAVTLAGLVALAGTSVAGWRHDTPQPAGTGTPTPAPAMPSPTSEATSTPTALPYAQGDPTQPYGACGALATAAPTAPFDGRYTAALTVDDTTVAAGQPIAVTTTLDDADGPSYSLLPAPGPRVAVLRDGVVVGTALPGTGSSTGTPSTVGGLPSWEIAGGFQGGARVTSDWLPLVACAPADGSADVLVGHPLPAGTYTLQPWAEVVALGDDDVALRGGASAEWPAPDALVAQGVLGTAVGEPVTVTITGAAETTAPLPGSDGEMRSLSVSDPAVCDAAPPDQAPGTPFTLTGPGGTLTLDDLGEPITSTLTYDGPGRVEYGHAGPWLTVVQHGEVVATTDFWWEFDATVTLGSGIGIDSTGTGELRTVCGGDALAPGDYQAYLSVGLSSPRVDASPRGTATVEGWSFVYSEPFTLRVG